MHVYVKLCLHTTATFHKETKKRALTREASYEGAGLSQESSRNFSIFTSSRLAIDQQHCLVARDHHLDFMTLTVTQWSRRAGNDGIACRYQNKLRTNKRSVFKSNIQYKFISHTVWVLENSHLAIHQCRDDSRPER